MNYDEMEAGRELDHLVEQRVFDRVPCDKWKYEYGGWGMAITGAGEIWRKGDCGHDNCYPEPYPPKRSTNIEAALKEVEKMDELYIEWSDKEWFVMVGEDFDTATRASTLPHAVCLARLKAKDSLDNEVKNG